MKEFARKENLSSKTMEKWISKLPALKEDVNAGMGSHKKKRKLAYPCTDAALAIWFRRMVHMGVPLTDYALLLQAKEFAIRLNELSFVASQGWLETWKGRHGLIRSFFISGELYSADMDAVVHELPRLHELLGQTLDDFRLNADETALYWRCLPSRTLGNAPEHIAGFKRSKDRITILVICNASGTYLHYFVIGKSAKPACFRGKVSIGSHVMIGCLSCTIVVDYIVAGQRSSF